MTFIETDKTDTEITLKGAFFEFPRAAKLAKQLKWCIRDYYVKASTGQDFEARGLIVTGESRVGKTKEIKTLIKQFNDSDTIMPNGKAGKIARCTLSGQVTWKNLGATVLRSLGYDLKRCRTNDYIWKEVLHQAERQGVIGIHCGECQHVFKGKSDADRNRIFLDSFKTLMKEAQWPFILILSGIPSLAGYVREEEQLYHLLRPVHFGTIDFDRVPENEGGDEVCDDFSDMEILNRLAFALADSVGMDFEPLSTEDFFERLNFASLSRWGLAIEFFIDAFVECSRHGRKTIAIDDFVQSFAGKSGIPKAMSPFTAPDYDEILDPTALLELLDED